MKEELHHGAMAAESRPLVEICREILISLEDGFIANPSARAERTRRRLEAELRAALEEETK